MRRVAIAIAVLLVVVGAGWLLSRTGDSTPARPAPSYAFEICVGRHDAGAGRAAAEWDGAVLAAVVRALTVAERASLEAAVETAATRWEARANPLLEDLGDGDPDATLVEWVRKAPPFVKTAQHAVQREGCGVDGLCAMPRPPGGACPAGTVAATESEIGRARFLVWPWGHALRFRAPDEGTLEEAAALLREKVGKSTRIAVVMAPGDTEVTRLAPFERLRELWTRRVVARRIAKGGDGTLPAGDETAIVPVAREIVILPRLDAIREDHAFEAEIRAVAPRLVPAR